MPFFQNCFDEYKGLFKCDEGLKTASVNFPIPGNRNRPDLMIAYNMEPYDLSSDNTLTINYSLDLRYRQYYTVAVNVAGVSASATTASEIAAKLTADAIFSDYFTASAENATRDGVSVMIRTKRHDRTALRAYISNSSAEKKLQFNKYAPVREMPVHFDRHTIENGSVFTDSDAWLVKLDESDSTDQAVITNAGLDYTAMQDDWELLDGRLFAYRFTKRTFNGGGNVTEEIHWAAGAGVGDLAKKITYSDYNGTTPGKIFEMPYTLQSGDLITP